MTTENTTRFPLIDYLRGLAVVLMIFFHFCYDLKLFDYVAIDFNKDLFWYGLPRFIVFLFMLCVGMSLKLAHGAGIRWGIFGKRVGILAALALVVSLVTYFMFPTRWVYFGTLHCIALCSLLTLPFLPLPWPGFVFGLGMIIPSLFFKLNIPWFSLSHVSMDYIAPFPWLGVSFLGVWSVHMNFHSWRPRVPKALQRGLNGLEFLGKKSLIIYMLHQPILYGVVFLFSQVAHLRAKW